jgi:hypothetical protein
VSIMGLVGPSRTSEGSSAPVKDREALSRFGRLMTDFFVDSTKRFRVSVLIVCKTSRRERRCRSVGACIVISCVKQTTALCRDLLREMGAIRYREIIYSLAFPTTPRSLQLVMNEDLWWDGAGGLGVFVEIVGK